MKHISKAERKRMTIARQSSNDAAIMALQFSKRRFKKFDDIIDALYGGEDMSAFLFDKRIAKVAEIFKLYPADVYFETRAFLREVLVHFSRHTLLVAGPEYIQALCSMARYRNSWKRNVFDWKPSAKPKAAQISELAAYLFCDFPAPAFLHKSFFEEKDQRFLNWYIQLGAGAKISELDQMPLLLTQKMRHFFLVAPESLSVVEALRWAQVKGMGGEDWLASRVSYSWLSTKPFGDEEFWSSFLQVLVREKNFCHDEVTGLIDYVREMKRITPGYTLKGRTFMSLRRQSNQWHQRFSGSRENYFWSPSGIGGLRIVKNEEEVIMEELTEYRFMVEEGRIMKHCVGSYAFYCAKGRSAIFSLRKYNGGRLSERLATIEVNMSLRRIVQAKAKMNTPLSAEAKKYMMIWKEKESLSLGSYV